MYIGVAGNIGAGKTTLAKILSQHFNIPLLKESVDDNPFLDKYYEDISTWAFRTQLYFVTSRVKTFIDNQKNHEAGILDRVLDEDKFIFTTFLYKNGYLSDEEFALYEDFFRLQKAMLKDVSVLIYIKSGVNRLKQNILKRNRPYEQDLIHPDNTYLEELNELYESWIQTYTDSPLIVIDANKVNIIEDEEKRKELLEEISSHL